ncbi:hypothetical protein ACFPES_01885 [Paenibacillus sp. GCM10023248]|uniref:hypothetical protein n=1 Tax=Bacillales TaxID=1385 RepID=UPI0023792476|nr:MULTISPECIES: hypothetical protein [Bacillales]MDD9265774.1 hypothetical protein [Paenibacillus sp. MAHUQ-63]MDR6879015.1 hypothetical protein [Bacillus sp. 3255]
MNDLDPRKAKWLKRKQLGRTQYLIRFGLIPWGAGLTVLFSIIEFLNTQQLSLVWVPIRIVLFFFVGFFVANASWMSMENRYEPSSRRP